MTDLDISVRHTIGSFHLALEFRTTVRLLAITGPSGSGKTTLVNMIAGLVTPEMGHIKLNGNALFERVRQINVPVHKRQIGYVFQDGRLFPHLSVRNNLLYGKWFAQSPSSINFDTIVHLLGLENLLTRGTSQLSGGERQRVAIGRALLSAPKLLLMDEPLASLDPARKNDILPYIERLRDDLKIPILYVSHQPDEIHRLADDVLTMEKGTASHVPSNYSGS
jgi:molybdate transport system ATP-binding protein